MLTNVGVAAGSLCGGRRQKPPAMRDLSKGASIQSPPLVITLNGIWVWPGVGVGLCCTYVRFRAFQGSFVFGAHGRI